MKASPLSFVEQTASLRACDDDTEELAAAAATGDTCALATLYDRYFEQSYRFVLVRVRDVHLAQDLTHDAWCAVVKGVREYELRTGGWCAWLFTILRSRINDHYRMVTNRRTSTVGPEVWEANEPADQWAVDPHSAATRKDAVDMVTKAMATLPEHYVDVLTARFWLGLSVQQAAAALGLSEGAVKLRQYRATKALGKALPSHAREL